MLTHGGLLSNLQLAGQTYSGWSTFTDTTAKILTDSFITTEVLVRNVAELPLVLWVCEGVSLELVF